MQASLLIVILSLGAPASKDPPPKEPSILGEWVAVSQEANGKPATPFADVLVFKPDGKWERVFEGRALRNCEKYEFGATAKPATLSLIFTPETNVAGAFGIIRVDGDTMTFSFGYNSRVRPQTFTTEAGSGNSVLVLTRKAKK
jgi:uncharacterized protein (TIGR03067 family)